MVNMLKAKKIIGTVSPLKRNMIFHSIEKNQSTIKNLVFLLLDNIDKRLKN